MRELRAILSNHSLAVDHQRKVVKRTLGGDVVGRGGQTFTICGDFGLICGVYVVPDTALSWTKKAMSEVIDRHDSAGVEVPRSLYMDCGCCSGLVSRSVAEQMVLVLKAHRELDCQCRTQAEAAGMDNLTVTDVAYPLVTKRLTGVYQQQLVHVRNGCISDDPECLPYVKVGTINYHLTSHHLEHYQSLHGTSKVEAVHSVLDRTFYTQRGIGTEVFDARLGWCRRG